MTMLRLEDKTISILCHCHKGINYSATLISHHPVKFIRWYPHLSTSH